MANMSHCRFENTYNNLIDCYNQLQEKGMKKIEDNANQYEREFVRNLVKLCVDISDEFGDELASLQNEKQPHEKAIN